MRERICHAHEEVHGVVYERVVRAKDQAGAASYGGLAAEVRAVGRARQGAASGGDVRRELLSLAASAIILAEREDRPADELPRGEKSTAKQWMKPVFGLGAEAA